MQFKSGENTPSNQKPEAPTSFPLGRVMSGQLLGNRRELIIEHDGREYRLRRTQNGRLILTA